MGNGTCYMSLGSLSGSLAIGCVSGLGSGLRKTWNHGLKRGLPGQKIIQALGILRCLDLSFSMPVLELLS